MALVGSFTDTSLREETDLREPKIFSQCTHLVCGRAGISIHVFEQLCPLLSVFTAAQLPDVLIKKKILSHRFFSTPFTNECKVLVFILNGLKQLFN